MNLAEVYKKQGKFEDAKSLYQKNLDIDPRHGETILSLLKLYADQSDEARMDGLVNQMIAKSKNGDLLIEAGGLLASARRVRMALACWMKALELSPRDPDVYLELGKLYGNLNQFEEAILIWGQGKKISPHDKRFDENVAKAKELRGQLNRN